MNEVNNMSYAGRGRKLIEQIKNGEKPDGAIFQYLRVQYPDVAKGIAGIVYDAAEVKPTTPEELLALFEWGHPDILES